MWRLAAKLAQYYAYRASSGDDQGTLLLITSGHHRVREVLHLNETVAAQSGATPLDLRVATDADLAAFGARVCIWHTASGACDTLFPWRSRERTIAPGPPLQAHG